MCSSDVPVWNTCIAAVPPVMGLDAPTDLSKRAVHVAWLETVGIPERGVRSG